MIITIFSAAHSCSKYDSLTGLTKQEFETPFTLPQTIGGWIPVSMKLSFVFLKKVLKDLGLKFSSCHVVHSCGQREEYNSVKEYG